MSGSAPAPGEQPPNPGPNGPDEPPPDNPSGTAPAGEGDRAPLRLSLWAQVPPGAPNGAWWPRSRDLQTEVADLVDHFPVESGRINRLLFSRPDWDDVVSEGRGVRRVRAARGVVKVGSFPADDTHEMVLSMSSGVRLRLRVVPSDSEAQEAAEALRGPSPEPAGVSAAPVAGP